MTGALVACEAHSSQPGPLRVPASAVTAGPVSQSVDVLSAILPMLASGRQPAAGVAKWPHLQDLLLLFLRAFPRLVERSSQVPQALLLLLPSEIQLWWPRKSLSPEAHGPQPPGHPEPLRPPWLPWLSSLLARAVALPPAVPQVFSLLSAAALLPSAASEGASSGFAVLSCLSPPI